MKYIGLIKPNRYASYRLTARIAFDECKLYRTFSYRMLNKGIFKYVKTFMAFRKFYSLSS